MKRLLPYPGLRPFEEDDHPIFFGREVQIVSVLALLEEQQFVAIVGSSGSGKSSLIRAGVIPAVRKGFLRGTSDWKVIVLRPGSNPFRSLAGQLLEAGLAPSGRKSIAAQPNVETLVAQLQETDRSLLDLVGPATRPEDATPHVLVVVDQFEELFTFRRAEFNASARTTVFASRDDAAAFVRMLLRCARGLDGAISVVITMRSDFIGDCDAFLDLPEAVSRCQFLVPRLNRSQMTEAIEGPGRMTGLGFAPFTFENGLVNQIISDAGDRLDQLPLMQHALMRTWKVCVKRAAPEREPVLTRQSYESEGGISEALSRHADEAWGTVESDPAKADLTRQLFLLLSDIHPDGKITRRRPTVSEALAVTGATIEELEVIVRLFQSDERNFLLPPLPSENDHLVPDDRLDLSHEALLRQWKVFGAWLIREMESKAWLIELSQAAKDLERKAATTELWQGNNLIQAEEWLRTERPTEAWARRNGVLNWSACMDFLEQSREKALRLQQTIREQKQREEEGLQRQRRRILTSVGAAGSLFFILFFVMTSLWNRSKESNAKADRLLQNFYAIAVPIVNSGKAAIAEAEEQAAKLIAAITQAAKEAPPEQAAIKEFQSRLKAADTAVVAIENLAKSSKEAESATQDPNLQAVANDIGKQAIDVRERRNALERSPEAFKAIEAAFETRLKEAENNLAGLDKKDPKDPLFVKLVNEKKEKEIPAATAHRAALGAITEAAEALGFEAKDFQKFEPRFSALFDTLYAIQNLSLETAASLTTWKPDAARALRHGGKVNRVRFVATTSGTLDGDSDAELPGSESWRRSPFIVSAGEDRTVHLWSQDGKTLAEVDVSSAVNDLAISVQAQAIAAASNGSTVRIVRWAQVSNLGNPKVDAFERHSDAVTDVAFSHGGERVASGSADRTVRVFNSRTLAQLYFTSPPLPGIVTSVAFHPGDNLVVSGCDDGGVRLHTIDQPGVQLLGKMEAPARRPEFSADGKLVIAASADMTARVWPIVAPREIANLAHPAPVTQATFRPVKDAEGYTFVTCATNGEVRSVRMASNTDATPAATVLEPRHPGAVLSATWSADGRWLATVGGGEVLVWDWASNSAVARLRLSGLHKDTSRAEFSENAALLATYGGDNTVQLWDLTKIPAQ